MDGTAIWILFLMFLPFLLFFFRMMLIVWKSLLITQKIKHLSEEIESRQNQLATVSRSIDTNSVYSNNGTPTRRRRDSDATLKIDLPPTYEEVMNNRHQTPETPSQPTESIELRDTHETTVAITIEPEQTVQQQSSQRNAV